MPRTISITAPKSAPLLLQVNRVAEHHTVAQRHRRNADRSHPRNGGSVGSNDASFLAPAAIVPSLPLLSAVVVLVM